MEQEKVETHRVEYLDEGTIETRRSANQFDPRILAGNGDRSKTPRQGSTKVRASNFIQGKVEYSPQSSFNAEDRLDSKYEESKIQKRFSKFTG